MGSESPQAPPPPPDASREEWRAWRRQGRRHYSYWGGHWAWFWGAVLVIVGGYSLLRNLGLLGWIRADIFWPLLVIALGAWLIIERAIPRQPPP